MERKDRCRYSSRFLYLFLSLSLPFSSILSLFSHIIFLSLAPFFILFAFLWAKESKNAGQRRKMCVEERIRKKKWKKKGRKIERKGFGKAIAKSGNSFHSFFLSLLSCSFCRVFHSESFSHLTISLSFAFSFYLFLGESNIFSIFFLALLVFLSFFYFSRPLGPRSVKKSVKE